MIGKWPRSDIGCTVHLQWRWPSLSDGPVSAAAVGYLHAPKFVICRNRTCTTLAENQALRSPDSQVDSRFKREPGQTFASLSARGIEEIEGAKEARATLERDIRAQEPQ
jgi:hypothetical protein